MIVDGHKVDYTDEKNILSVVRKAGIELPTFCYYSELSIYGACRMCVVEDNRGGILASCSTPPKDGMEVKTATPKIHKYRKMILELLLASHCSDCPTCDKSGKCRLQDLALRYGVKNVRFENHKDKLPLDFSSPSITRDPNKCILCGDCVRMCNEVQGVGALDFAFRGSKMQVSPAFGKEIGEVNCVNCGQCVAVCPTAAITVKKDADVVWEDLYNPNKRVIAQIAPAVRVALGEEFGIYTGESVMGKVVGALKKLGFDEVYDTSLGSDLTVMEESAELMEYISEDKGTLFTSCCPAWIRYAETRHPELLKNISSCRSPQQMFGSLIKEHYRGMVDDTKETVMVAIMPCTAKKYEAAREEFVREGQRDVDVVITTQELAGMIREAGYRFEDIVPEATDMPFGLASGAGILFGVTGGVTEAVLRKVIGNSSADSLKEISFTGVRGMEGTKEASLDLDGKIVKIAIVSGLTNVENLLQKLKTGEVHYDFVEVMACPYGCIGGGGQPFSLYGGKELRAAGIYQTDKLSQIKSSEKNPMIESLTNGILKGRTHELLHVHYGK